MSLALSWGDESDNSGGLIFFDATTAYTRNNKGQVTKHPISSGGVVTDHFIKDNPTITLSAVISGADISNTTYLIRDGFGNAPYNSFDPPTLVSVNSSDKSVLQKFIPDSIGQFLSDSSPEVEMDSTRDDVLEIVRSELEKLMSGVIFNSKTGQFDPNIQVVKILEYDGAFFRKLVDNLVITNITFKEDPNSGYALYFDMSLEQVTFAFLKKTTIPKDVLDSLKKKAEKKDTKGKVDSTANTGDAPKEDIDPQREAIRNNG